MIKESVFALALIVIVVSLTVFLFPRHQTVRIDCTIAEISPDIPVDAKEMCRQLRQENLKK
jgi:hypothetical protein